METILLRKGSKITNMALTPLQTFALQYICLICESPDGVELYQTELFKNFSNSMSTVLQFITEAYLYRMITYIGEKDNIYLLWLVLVNKPNDAHEEAFNSCLKLQYADSYNIWAFFRTLEL